MLCEACPHCRLKTANYKRKMKKQTTMSRIVSDVPNSVSPIVFGAGAVPDGFAPALIDDIVRFLAEDKSLEQTGPGH
jgi:hypothetical protein